MNRKVWLLIMIKVVAVLAFLLLGMATGAEAAPKAVITWTDNSTGEEFFELQKAPALAGPWSAFAKTGANVISAEDTNVVAGQTVCYRVRAGTSAVVTAFSVGKCATAPNTLAVPTNLIVVIENQ